MSLIMFAEWGLIRHANRAPESTIEADDRRAKRTGELSSPSQDQPRAGHPGDDRTGLRRGPGQQERREKAPAVERDGREVAGPLPRKTAGRASGRANPPEAP